MIESAQFTCLTGPGMQSRGPCCARYAPGEPDLRRLAGVSAAHIGLLPDPAPLREWQHACGVLVSQDCAVTRPGAEPCLAPRAARRQPPMRRARCSTPISP